MPRFDDPASARPAPLRSPQQKHPRYAASAPVDVKLGDADVVTLPLVNISLGGLFLRAERAPPPGSRVLVHLRAQGAAIGAAARVVHVIDAGASASKHHPPGMGLEFERLSEDSKRALERLVQGLADAARASREARARLEDGRVVVETRSRAELQTLWAQDLSKGGLFVPTEAPPPLATRLPVALLTPDGRLSLVAEVVHVLDAATARAAGHPAGAGLQLVDLEGRKRAALEDYVRGDSAILSGPGTGREREAPSWDVIQRAVLRLFQGVERGDVHLALGLSKAASEREQGERLAELKTLFHSLPPGATPQQLTRLAAARRVLARVEQHLEAWRRAGHGELTRLEGAQNPAAHRQRTALLRQGLLEARRGDLLEARRTLTAALELVPDDVEVKARLAAVTAAIQRGRALELLEPADTFLATGMRRQAVAHAQKALALSSAKDVRALALKILYGAGVVVEALALARELCAEDPALAFAWEVRLALHEQEGQLPLALQAGEALLALRPADGKLKSRVKKLRARARR